MERKIIEIPALGEEANEIAEYIALYRFKVRGVLDKGSIDRFEELEKKYGDIRTNKRDSN